MLDVHVCNVTKANYQQIIGLKVAPEQQIFTLNNAQALVAVLFEPRRVGQAIVDRQQQAPVGFLIYGPTETPGHWWLYHLMVDAANQHQGYGRAALEQLVTLLNQNPTIKYLHARYHATNTIAANLAAKIGFQQTQNIGEDQIEVIFDLPTKTLPKPNITLRDVTLANARACIQLQVAPHQAQFVASNAESLILSKFEPHWFTKTIYNDTTMVGFVMYGHDPEFGWGILRLMTDASHQGRGYGRAALRQVLAHIHAEGGKSVGVSYEDANVIARQLYNSLGFIETGEKPFGQPFAILNLSEHNF